MFVFCFAIQYFSCEHQLWAAPEDVEENPDIHVWDVPGDVGPTPGGIRQFSHTLALWRNKCFVISKK